MIERSFTLALIWLLAHTPVLADFGAGGGLQGFWGNTVVQAVVAFEDVDGDEFLDSSSAQGVADFGVAQKNRHIVACVHSHDGSAARSVNFGFAGSSAMSVVAEQVGGDSNASTALLITDEPVSLDGLTFYFFQFDGGVDEFGVTFYSVYGVFPAAFSTGATADPGSGVSIDVPYKGIGIGCYTGGFDNGSRALTWSGLTEDTENFINGGEAVDNGAASTNIPGPTTVTVSGSPSIDAGAIAAASFAPAQVPEDLVEFLGAANASANNGGDPVVSLTGLGLQEDDLVLICASASQDDIAGATEIAINSPSGYTVSTYEVAGGGSNEGVEFLVGYKIQGSTPDTSVTINGTADTSDTAVAIAMGFRNVSGTQFDVAQVVAGGTSNQPNPPSISPITERAMGVVCGSVGAAAINGAAEDPDASDGFKTPVAEMYIYRGDSNDTEMLAGFAEFADTGPLNPGAFSGMFDEGVRAWVAATIAIRPGDNIILHDTGGP